MSTVVLSGCISDDVWSGVGEIDRERVKMNWLGSGICSGGNVGLNAGGVDGIHRKVVGVGVGDGVGYGVGAGMGVEVGAGLGVGVGV